MYNCDKFVVEGSQGRYVGCLIFELHSPVLFLDIITMTITIGKFSHTIEPKTIKLVQHSDQTDSLAPGDIVQSWDHITEWDESCVSDKQAKVYVPSSHSE